MAWSWIHWSATAYVEIFFETYRPRYWWRKDPGSDNASSQIDAVVFVTDVRHVISRKCRMDCCCKNIVALYAWQHPPSSLLATDFLQVLGPWKFRIASVNLLVAVNRGTGGGIWSKLWTSHLKPSASKFLSRHWLLGRIGRRQQQSSWKWLKSVVAKTLDWQDLTENVEYRECYWLRPFHWQTGDYGL
jgi:hypothetical protein